MTDIIKEIHLFKNTEQMADSAIEKWTNISNKEIKNKGYFSAALSGGKTPAAFYQKLSEGKTLPWDNTHIFMVDERFVPYESDENNYHMINRMLLRHVGIRPKNVHPILTSEFSPQTSAEKYEADIISYCKTFHTKLPRFDLMFLGIGEDGHTASLFPDTPSLKEMRRFVLYVTMPDKKKNERITLTLPIINLARNIIFLAAGENKAKIIREVIEDKNSLLPASVVKPQEGKLFFLLDEAAGSLLSEREII